MAFVIHRPRFSKYSVYIHTHTRTHTHTHISKYTAPLTFQNFTAAQFVLWPISPLPLWGGPGGVPLTLRLLGEGGGG
jgi:hypothetical protein